jgi:hypothetical protein
MPSGERSAPNSASPAENAVSVRPASVVRRPFDAAGKHTETVDDRFLVLKPEPLEMNFLQCAASAGR